ncbi:MAG TPA: hypothetical protein VFB72_02820 [Verrucomicrobiae bacterium]|nr:hypothetical protein [Verrucomicrobiae bacterium]
MKYPIILFAFIISQSLFGQMIPHHWSATLNVKDELGQPLAGAEAWVAYMATNKFTGVTDTNGNFEASHTDRSHDLVFHVSKLGYYDYLEKYELGFPSQYNERRWNPQKIIVLSKIINPVPMYAKLIASPPPATNKPVGYDLNMGDWVQPFGRGLNSDMIFTQASTRKSFQDYEYKLTVSFPNIGDGIGEFATPVAGSGLRSPHEAPNDGYNPQVVRLNISHPGQQLVFDYNENRNYFIRVRTKLDKNGNVLSANYGKIYGDFMNFR